MTLPRYGEYKDSGIEWLGEVPKHWNVVPIKHFGWLKGGAGFPHEEQGNDGEELDFHKVNALGSASADGVIRQSENTISRRIAQKLGAHVFPERTLVFAKVGAALLLGRVRQLASPACIDNNLMGFVVAQDAGDVSFVRYAMSLVRFDLIANPGAVPSLNEAQIGNYLLVRPPLPEQTAIAAFLDRETGKIDALVAEQEKLVALLKEKRQAVISHAVTKGLDPTAPMKDSGIEWLGEVPALWEVIRLGALFKEMMDGGEEGLPILSVSIHDGVSDKELTDEELDRKVTRSEDTSKYKKVIPGDLVYNMMRAWQGGFGTVMVSGMVSPAYVVARPIREFSSSFAELMLRTSKAVEEMRRRSHGVTDFRLRLYWDEFKSMSVTLPPHNEQHQILALVDKETAKLDALTAEAQRGIDLLKERRTALISAAVTGKVDVRGLVGIQEEAA